MSDVGGCNNINDFYDKENIVSLDDFEKKIKELKKLIINKPKECMKNTNFQGFISYKSNLDEFNRLYNQLIRVKELYEDYIENRT